MRVAVVDHGMGNLRSVRRALEAAGAAVEVTADAEVMRSADALCVPGQGIFGKCMVALTETGVGDLIRDWVAEGRPYLGICLGMQVLFDDSEEGGGMKGLGIVGGTVVRLPSSVRVPHIGWNTVSGDLDGYFYFDHSYAAEPADGDVVTGWCEHGRRFAAAVGVDSITAYQFHPEKSGGAGIELLRKWVSV